MESDMTGADTGRLRVLFVDDEPNVLKGLKRMLRSMRHQWDMDFSENGTEALAKMEESPFDIVVSDLRMPGIDGIELLKKVKKRYPRTVRFILSGNVDEEMIIQSVGPAHQFLSKPCDAEILKSTVSRAFALRRLLSRGKVLDVVTDPGRLPTLPELYHQFRAVLNSTTSTAADIGEVIARDVSISTKILQLVNSAFFGVPRKIDNMGQAVAYLGVETINSIVLTTGMFDRFEESRVREFGIRGIYGHSVAAGVCAGKILRSHIRNRKMAEECILAGMVHDFGKLAFITTGHEDWRAVFKRHVDENRPLHEVEQEMLGITHAEIGAYLLGVWGVSDNIVEAVAFHHRPSGGHTSTFGTLTALHLANVFEHRLSSDGPVPEVDEEYIADLGLTHDLPEIEAVCRSIREKRK